MKKSTQLHERYKDTIAIGDVSQILESIASIRIRQIKGQVIASREFFRRLWAIYSQLRVSDKEAGLLYRDQNKINRAAVLLVTSNSGLSGEIDSQLVNAALAQNISADIDFFVIGLHGARLLEQKGVTATQVFPLPDIAGAIEVNDIVAAISRYRAPVVYYQSFVSLTTQEVIYFALIETVRRLTDREQEVRPDELIYPDECLFEPSVHEVIGYLETMMIGTTITEVILESSLAQLASRFTAMNAATARAKDVGDELFRRYSQFRRYERDELSRRYSHRRKVYQ